MSARAELWGRLLAANLVAGDMPDATGESSPWYVKAMIAIAAWIASILLLIFLGILLHGVFDSPSGLFVIGVLICGGCATLMYVARGRDFVTQMAVATSLAGQALIAFSILDHHWQSPQALAAFAAIEAILVVAAPNYVHRVLTTLFAAWALRFAFAYALLAPVFLPLCAAAFVLADRASLRQAWSGWTPISTGLALSVLFTIPFSLGEIFWWPSRNPLGLSSAGVWWFAAIALALVLMGLVASILRDNDVPWTSRPAVVALAAAATCALVARPVAGITVGLIVLVAAYAHGRRALCGLAIAGLIVALSHYYYALDATLLQKSAALLATGIVLLVAGLAVRSGLAGEVSHA